MKIRENKVVFGLKSLLKVFIFRKIDKKINHIEINSMWFYNGFIQLV